MDFNQLCDIMLAESKKKDAPRLGQLGKSVSEAEGPKGFSKGSAGFNNKDVVKDKLTRWEWEPEITGDYGDSGGKAMKKIYKTLGIAFRLLMNDPDFDKRMTAMMKGMAQGRESYGRMVIDQDKKGKDITKDEEKVASDYGQQIQKWNGLIETKRSKIEYLNAKKREDELHNKSRHLAAYEKEIGDLENEISEIEPKIAKYQDILDKVLERTNQIEETNRKLNDDKIEAFKYYLHTTANHLLLDLGKKMGETTLSDLSQLDWDSLPKENSIKLDMLQALASDNPDVNPILGFLDIYNKRYDEREQTLRSDELNSNVNITKVRDFESLPFFRLYKLYQGIKHDSAFGKTPIKINMADSDNANKDSNSQNAQLQLTKTLQNMKTEEEWNNPNTKSWLISQLNMLDISNVDKQALVNFVNSNDWIEIGAKTTATVLLNKLNKSIKTLSENFDHNAGKILNSINLDTDSHELIMMEVMSRLSN